MASAVSVHRAFVAAVILSWTAFVSLGRTVEVSRALALRRRGGPRLERVWIDVNRSPLFELTLLPGIGPGRAEAIVLHRVRHGPFRTLGDLVEVDGIGLSTVDGLRRFAIAGPPGGESEVQDGSAG